MDRDIKKLEEIDELEDKISKCIKRLIELSYDEHEEIRMVSLDALDIIRTNKVENRIREGLNDSDELVKHSCLEILGMWKDKSSVEIIKKCLNDESWLVRSEAALTLAEIGDQSSISIIKEKVENADDEEVVRFYYALAKLGKHEYFNKFLNCMYDEYYRIRCATAHLIGEMTNSNNKQFFLNFLNSAMKGEESVAVLSSIEDVIKEISEKFDDKIE